jgi:glycosyltransferase involved in cell wall biosynthesis
MPAMPLDQEATPRAYPHPYLLVVNVPMAKDEGGGFRVPELWFHDLEHHTEYLKALRLAAPTRATISFGPSSPLGDLPIDIVELPPSESMLGMLRELPKLTRTLFRAVSEAHTVHTGVAGWPLPVGWIVTPMALLLRKRLIIVVESAPWRTHDGSLKERLRAMVYENMARFCVRRADLSFFTQSEYRSSLLAANDPRGHVVHASWIDARQIMHPAVALTAWNQKREADHARFVFAGRLTEPKGVRILLAAAKLLDARGVRTAIDVFGTGALTQECAAVASTLKRVELRLRGVLPYDDTFFAALGTYHALVVPSLSDEQPRIVYDAYSQAVPVIASATAGLRDCVFQNATGWLIPPGNEQALADALERASRSLPLLAELGLGGLERARTMTHQHMHARRAELLNGG